MGSRSNGGGLSDIIILKKEEKSEYNPNKQRSKTHCYRTHGQGYPIAGGQALLGGVGAGGGGTAAGGDSDDVFLPSPPLILPEPASSTTPASCDAEAPASCNTTAFPPLAVRAKEVVEVKVGLKNKKH